MEAQSMYITKASGLQKIIKKIFFIAIGNLLCSLAFNIFFIPSKLLSGGAGGLGIMTQYLTDIPSGIAVFFINLPIFALGLKALDKEFISYAFVSTFILSFFLTITRGLGQYFVMDDILLSAVFGGIFNGVGMGLMFRNRTCQGGFDIIAAILRKKYNVNIGTALMAANTVIISLSSLLFGYKSAMYTLIGLFVSYKILDKVQTGFNVKKNVIIVSDKSQELADEIIERLHRGVTFLQGTGGYSRENKRVIYCIVTSVETAKLKEIIEHIDPAAFLIINDVVEVKGSSFKSIGM